MSDDEEEGPPTHREGRGAQYRRETEAFLTESLMPPKSTRWQRALSDVVPLLLGFALGVTVGLLAMWLLNHIGG